MTFKCVVCAFRRSEVWAISCWSQKSFQLPKPSNALNLDRYRSVCLQPQAKRVAINLWQKKRVHDYHLRPVCAERSLKPYPCGMHCVNRVGIPLTWHLLLVMSLWPTWPCWGTILEQRGLNSIGCEWLTIKLCTVHKVQHKTRWLLRIILCADIISDHHYHCQSSSQWTQAQHTWGHEIYIRPGSKRCNI